MAADPLAVAAGVVLSSGSICGAKEQKFLLQLEFLLRSLGLVLAPELQYLQIGAGLSLQESPLQLGFSFNN